MRVIRCEHPSNPTATIRPIVVHGLPWDDQNLPCPWDEGFEPSRHQGEWNCAAHPETLDIWFPSSERDKIRARGYRFMELEVDPIFVGRLQVIIDRAAAREIGEYLQ